MKILLALLSYFFGAIPSGYIFFHLSEKKDIRNFGSQTTGATNVLRLKGFKYALPVGLFDVFKGFLPVFLALILFQDKLLALACASLAVLGHCFPVFIKFKGGKGLATTFGAYAVLAFKPFLLSVAIFLIVAGISRYVSLSSLLAALSYPFFIFLFKEEVEIAYLSFALFLLIMFMHRGNIKRLIKGKERKLGEKAK
ncbi:MAG: glycerol-3-phosphate 1-O-acyltransferase PlsY [Candidatus Aminicenantes bacterium]|nr:glycerol-3-phosphate 1-O-acyltransferase PlsY [Candidatus Aminicenantes bacterium]MBL7082281.1 glycerol-3-phosphate 1-O-acyltransferase PlsY [Candidatus Aminicenantes bacterium]